MDPAIITRLDGLDVAGCDRAAVENALSQLAQVRAWVEHHTLRLTLRLEELAVDNPGLWPEKSIASTSKTSMRDARHTTRRAAVLKELPALGELLGAGEISPGHLDSVANGLARLEDRDRQALLGASAEIVDGARRLSPEKLAELIAKIANRVRTDDGVTRFEKQRRATNLRWWTDPHTGMLHVHGAFDPESGLKITRRIQAAVEALFHSGVPDTCPDGETRQDHLRALALLQLLDGSSIDEGSSVEEGSSVDVKNPARVDIVIVIDLATLRGGMHEASLVDAHGADLAVATIRRMACEANLIPVVLNGHGVVLDLGRKQRLASWAQRHALRVMHPHCAIPDCTVRFDHCQIHHLDPFEPGGPTNLDNLLPLCNRHHHAAHEGGWQLHLHPTTRTLTITHPETTTQSTGPPQARAA